jgi:hypothetical protein
MLAQICKIILTNTHTYIHTHSFQDVLSHGNRYKMFEMTEERPSYWGPFDNHSDLFSPGERKNDTIVIALHYYTPL